ncbi:MAG: deoxyribose-phosphate aldolase [Lentisphaeria bacterium]
MMWTREKVAATIDHAVLKPSMTDEDILQGCRLGKKYQVASVCVRPSDVAAASRELAGSGVKVSMVVGFPHGANRSEVKALEARLAIQDGAQELDMVMNIGKFLSGQYDYVRDDIRAVVNEAKPHGVLVKVIFESCFLTLEQVAKATELSIAAGADFVKTSTGFADGSATPEAVATMIKTAAGRIKVKPSGGIRDYAKAVAFLEQGADRLGVGATAAVLDGAPANADDKY